MNYNGDGFSESNGTHVTPRSIYLQQLEDRLGAQAVDNIATEAQKTGNIYEMLAAWAGNGELGTTIMVAEDASFSAKKTDETDGSGNSLFVRAAINNITAAARRSVLKFNLTGQTNQVTSAKLRLKVNREGSPTGTKHNLYLMANDSWNANTITWNNSPAPGSLIESKVLVLLGEWMEFDVTSAVNTEINGDGLLSLLLAGFGTENVFTSYFSMNATDAANHPELVLTRVAIDDATTTWTGAVDKIWSNAGNWSDAVPTIAKHAVIPSGLSRYPKATSAAIVKSVSLENGATLIANSSFTGAVIYKRSLANKAGNLNGWHLLSSPVSGENYDNAYTIANSIAFGSSTNRAIATYNESGNNWGYFIAGGDATFNPGQGYSIKRSLDGFVSFTGNIHTADVTIAALSRTTGTNKGFNLVGNPYTSYMSSKNFLNNNPNLDANKNIWTWSNVTNTYTSRVAIEDFIISPSQGFFVQLNAGTNAVTFEKTNQIDNSGTDTFQKEVPKTLIKLNLKDDTTFREAKIYYLPNASKGFESGYEGEIFGGIPNNFHVYTHVLENNTGKNYQVQSLPNTAYESMVVPVGVKANADTALTFSIEAFNLPAGIKVFLEDRNMGTFTRLDETNSMYKIKLTDGLNGVGRFYLHTKQSVLSANDFVLSGISVYKTTTSKIRITGLSSGKVTFSLFNMLGQKVMTRSFVAAGVKDVSLVKLVTGVYIVELETQEGKLKKKIILE